MVAARSAIGILGWGPEAEDNWSTLVWSLDWHRLLIEARGRHFREHEGTGDDTCGDCLRTVVLGKNWLDDNFWN